MFLITNLLTFLFVIWMCAKIWPVSAPMAIASFFIFPVAIIHLVRYWGDQEHDIKVPFFLIILSSAYSVYSFMSYFGPDAQESMLHGLRVLA